MEIRVRCTFFFLSDGVFSYPRAGIFDISENLINQSINQWGGSSFVLHALRNPVRKHQIQPCDYMIIVTQIVIVCVCVFCVFSYHLFWTSELWTHQPEVTQKKGRKGFFHLSSEVFALIFIARRIQSSV